MATNKNKAEEVLREAYDLPHMAPVEMCENMVNALEEAGLLLPDVQVIRTLEELEALEIEDADAIALVTEVGVARTVRALSEMHRFGSIWGLPAVVIATGEQVRAAREAMEQDNG